MLLILWTDINNNSINKTRSNLIMLFIKTLLHNNSNIVLIIVPDIMKNSICKILTEHG